MKQEISCGALSFSERAGYASHPLAKRLFLLMDEKKSNLGLVADVTSSNALLHLAETLGPHLCVFKTHIDILEDFTIDVAKKLRQLSEKHNFLLFEDRKFADIGHVAMQQYGGGMYRISEWAHLTNAHPLPGPGVIDGLQKVGQTRGNGLLLVAQLSSQANLIDETYTMRTVDLALKYPDFVVGFICQKRLTDNPAFLHLTPGVQKLSKGDSLGQQYNTPEHAIIENGTDIILVGRGIIQQSHPEQAAKEYRDIAWKAYQERERARA